MRLQIADLQEWLRSFEPDNWVQIEEGYGLLIEDGPDDQDYRIEFEHEGSELQVLTLTQIKDGTGFAKGARFVLLPDDSKATDVSEATAPSNLEVAVMAERKRCINIVNAARFGTIDNDLRCIRSWIESGDNAEAS